MTKIIATHQINVKNAIIVEIILLVQKNQSDRFQILRIKEKLI